MEIHHIIRSSMHPPVMSEEIEKVTQKFLLKSLVDRMLFELTGCDGITSDKMEYAVLDSLTSCGLKLAPKR